MNIELPELFEEVKKDILKWLNTPTTDEEKEYLERWGVHWFEDEELFEDWMKKKLELAIVKAIAQTRAECVCLFTFAQVGTRYIVQDKIEEIEKEKERIDREFDKPSEAVIEVLWELYRELDRSYEERYRELGRKKCKLSQKILCTCGCSTFEYVDGELDSLCNDWRLLKCANCGRLWKLKLECMQDGNLEIHLVDESEEGDSDA